MTTTMMMMKTLRSYRLSTSRRHGVTGCSLSARLFAANTTRSSRCWPLLDQIKKRHRISKFPPSPPPPAATETTRTNCCPLDDDRQRTRRTCSFSSSPPQNSTAHHSLPCCKNGNKMSVSQPPIVPEEMTYYTSSLVSRRRRGQTSSSSSSSLIARKKNPPSLGLQKQQEKLLLRAGLELGLLLQQPFSPRHQQQMISFYSSTNSPPPPPPPPPANQDGDKKRPESSSSSTSSSISSDNNSSSSKKVLLSHWRQQLKSIPNIITCTRMACAPLLSYWIVTQQHEAALCGCILAGFSDYADGQVAKRFQMQTTLGTYLDPLADKILINVLAVSVWFTGTLPAPLVALWMGKDVLLMTATYRYVASQTRQRNNINNAADGKENTTLHQQHHHQQYVMDPLSTPLKVEPTVTSKINTALQFVTLATALVHPLCVDAADAGGAGGAGGVAATAVYYLDPALFYLCWITGGTTILSVFSYAGYSAFTDSGNSNQKKEEH